LGKNLWTQFSSNSYSKLVALKRYNGISLAVKALACRNAGFNCDAVIRGNTEEEIMASTMEHAIKAHNMKPEEVADEEFEEHVRGLITTAC
jgi:predicted small metal-binding protein